MGRQSRNPSPGRSRGDSPSGSRVTPPDPGQDGAERAARPSDAMADQPPSRKRQRRFGHN